MSAVFGCWQLDGRPIDAEIFERCVARLSPSGHQHVQTWTDTSIALGCTVAEPVDRDPFDLDRRHTAAVCAFDGRIDNRDALIRVLSADDRVHSRCSDRDLALAAYDRFGERCAEHIQGDFAFGIFDRRANRLLLARDRLGLRPLCYADRDGLFLFASDAKALLAYPGWSPKLDELKLADFALSFRAADSQSRTFFEGVRSLPPAHILVVTPRGVTLQRYFDFTGTPAIRFGTVDDYASAFHELFRESVRARLRCAKPVAISVSGGLDSAYIFCVARQAVHGREAACPDVRGVNYAGVAGTPSEEDACVRELERATGASIDRVPQRPGFMAYAADEVWQSESPMVEGLACQAQAALHRVSESGAGRFLTGHWGDQLLSDSDYVLDLLRSARLGLLRRHCRGWRIGPRQLAVRLGRDLARQRLSARVLAAVRAARSNRHGLREALWYTPRFRALLRERASQPPLEPPRGTRHAAAIYRQSRLGYHVQCMEWNCRIGAAHGLDIAFPYLDAALIQFLMSIPGEIQSHGGTPRGLMRRAMRGTVPDAIIDRRTKGEFTQLTNHSIEVDFTAIAELLGPSALSVSLGYVDGPILWRALPEWRAAIRRADDALLTNRIVDLCGFELLLRGFFSTPDPMALDQHASLATC